MRQILLILCGIMTSVVSFAQTQPYVLKVGSFETLRVVDDINVEYVCNPDSAGMAVFETVPEISHELIFTNNGKGKLTINVGTDALERTDLPTIRVYSASLLEAINEGVRDLTIVNVAPNKKVKLKLSDNGKIIAKDLKMSEAELSIITGRGEIIASGECEKVTLRNLGTGELKADKLVSKDVNCRIGGTGTITCHVDGGILSIRGLGTGKVYYTGDPAEVKSLQLGTIKAIRLKETPQEETKQI